MLCHSISFVVFFGPTAEYLVIIVIELDVAPTVSYNDSLQYIVGGASQDLARMRFRMTPFLLLRAVFFKYSRRSEPRSNLSLLKTITPFPSFFRISQPLLPSPFEVIFICAVLRIQQKKYLSPRC